MFQLFKSAESKRIEFLFHRYKELMNKGLSDEQARIELITELPLRGTSLKALLANQKIETQRRIINDMFSPLEVVTYNVLKLIGFMIEWEFPDKYNYVPTIEQIRSGNHPQAKLEKNISRIEHQIL